MFYKTYMYTSCNTGSRENNSYRNGADNRKTPQKTSPQKDRGRHSRHSKFSDNRGGIFKPDLNRWIWCCAGSLTWSCGLLIMTTSIIVALIGYMFFCVWSTNAICPGNQSGSPSKIISNNAVHPNEGTGKLAVNQLVLLLPCCMCIMYRHVPTHCHKRRQETRSQDSRWSRRLVKALSVSRC